MKVLNNFLLFSLLSTAVLSINMRRGVSAFTQLLHYEEVCSERLEIAGALRARYPFMWLWCNRPFTNDSSLEVAFSPYTICYSFSLLFHMHIQL